ncbi:MAG: HlyC/CorC family transporter [Deltaproteobacteria bacterium]|nr:HlyC/CorC family transporter [Deltaproteobacteria bacterium]
MMLIAWPAFDSWGPVAGGVLLCLLTEGFFSGSELALVSCDKARLHQRAAGGSRGAQLAERLLKNPAHLFGTTLLGTNLSTIAASTLTTFYLISLGGPALGSFAILLAPVILIFAEILPKSIYQHHADRLVDRIAPILFLFRSCMYPAILLLARITERFLGEVRRASTNEPRINREELQLLLHGDEAVQSDIRPNERKMVTRILRLAERRVKHAMIPLSEMECVVLESNRDEALTIFALKGYAHLPVYAHRVDNVIGILEAADVLCAASNTPLSGLMHSPAYVPEEMPIPELIRLLRGRQERAAVVVDEYGATVGLVALEAICEELVGEIHDEFAWVEPRYRALGPQHYWLQGRLELDDAQRLLGLDVPKGDYKTIGGLLLAQMGSIPRAGAQCTIGAWRFTVREANARTIVAVEAQRMEVAT